MALALSHPLGPISEVAQATDEAKGLNPISDEWGNIEVEGEVLADELGKFGTWTVREASIAP